MAEGVERGRHRHRKGPNSTSAVDTSGSPPRVTVNSVNGLDLSIQRKEKCGFIERFDLDASPGRSSMQIVKAALTQGKEGPSVGQKSKTLEEAIAELENVVAELRPPSTEAPDPKNASQAVKRRLPPEIKLKLAGISGITGEKARVIQTLLFVAGVNTLLQTLFGTRYQFALHSARDSQSL